MLAFRTLVAAVAFQALTAVATPIEALPEALPQDLVERTSNGTGPIPAGGSHLANFYSGNYCSGTTYDGPIQNFGCGGHCYNFEDGNGGFNTANSIFLQQSTTKNPKPTANVYSDPYCNDYVGKAGILKNQNSGCTNFVFQSAYLYFDC